MRHCYALLSGGLDSTLAILYIISKNEPVRVTPIFFDYGQKAREEESNRVQQLVPVLREKAVHRDTVIDDCRLFDINSSNNGLFSWSQSPILESRPKKKDVDLENRNMVLISCVVSIILSERKIARTNTEVDIIVGFLNEYYDTKLKFVRSLNRLFESMRLGITVVAPLIPESQGNKAPVSPRRLVDIAHSLDALAWLDKNTWSCYYPKFGNYCDNCHPCSKRKNFFKELGMKKLKNKPRKRLW